MIISVYVSYGREENSQKILKKLKKELLNADISILYDEEQIEFRGDIKKFMDDIGKAEHIIVIISDKYLRSPYCMYELLTIHEKDRFKERIYPIVLESAKIYDPIESLDYIRHWELKIKKFDKAIDGMSKANLHGITDDLNIYTKIRSKIAELSSILKGMNNLDLKTHEKTRFKKIIESIKQDAARNLFSNDQELFNESPRKFFDQLLMDIDVTESLSAWLNTNKLRLIESTLEHIPVTKNRNDSPGATEKLKSDIFAYLLWMTACLDQDDIEIPISNYINLRTIGQKELKKHKEIFQLMHKQLIDPTTKLKPDIDEELLLLGFIDYLQETYLSK